MANISFVGLIAEEIKKKIGKKKIKPTRQADIFLNNCLYCFTDPNVKPRTRWRCTNKINMNAGIIAAVPRAAILSQAVPVDVTNEVETTGIVLSPV